MSINHIKLDGKIYKAESLWRDSKKKLKKDTNNKLYPYPTEGSSWSAMHDFYKYLLEINKYLKFLNKYSVYDTPKKCIICNEKNISRGMYIFNDYIWEDGLTHYINNHKIKPSDDFIDFIYSKNFNKHKPYLFKYHGKLYKRGRIDYVKLTRNQLNILDALMIHGGYNKKYVDKNNDYKYSEHLGVLEFDKGKLYKIIISGDTTFVDKKDNEILLPTHFDILPEYEYMFHTHPPTPKPGGRAINGLLYEFPSIGDILHFIYNHNIGHIIGSLVITPEGLYNIRKHFLTNDKIIINENELFKKFNSLFNSVNRKTIQKYGTNFTLKTFYSEISQNTEYINELNKLLNEYDINIDFFPRKQDKENQWIIDSIYLPVYKQNIIN